MVRFETFSGILWEPTVDSLPEGDATSNVELERAKRQAVAIESLTERQKETIILASEGLNKEEVGRRLYISAQTVATHQKRVFAVLEVNSVREAVYLFLKHGVIEISEQESSIAEQRVKGLTPRRLETLALIASGKSTNEMAQILGISAEGLKGNLGNMYEKVGAKNIVHALRIGFAAGLSGDELNTSDEIEDGFIKLDPSVIKLGPYQRNFILRYFPEFEALPEEEVANYLSNLIKVAQQGAERFSYHLQLTTSLEVFVQWLSGVTQTAIADEYKLGAPSNVSAKLKTLLDSIKESFKIEEITSGQVIQEDPEIVFDRSAQSLLQLMYKGIELPELPTEKLRSIMSGLIESGREKDKSRLERILVGQTLRQIEVSDQEDAYSWREWFMRRVRQHIPLEDLMAAIESLDDEGLLEFISKKLKGVLVKELRPPKQPKPPRERKPKPTPEELLQQKRIKIGRRVLASAYEDERIKEFGLNELQLIFDALAYSGVRHEAAERLQETFQGRPIKDIAIGRGVNPNTVTNSNKALMVWLGETVGVDKIIERLHSEDALEQLTSLFRSVGKSASGVSSQSGHSLEEITDPVETDGVWPSADSKRFWAGVSEGLKAAKEGIRPHQKGATPEFGKMEKGKSGEDDWDAEDLVRETGEIESGEGEADQDSDLSSNDEEAGPNTEALQKLQERLEAAKESKKQVKKRKGWGEPVRLGRSQDSIDFWKGVSESNKRPQRIIDEDISDGVDEILEQMGIEVPERGPAPQPGFRSQPKPRGNRGHAF